MNSLKRKKLIQEGEQLADRANDLIGDMVFEIRHDIATRLNGFGEIDSISPLTFKVLKSRPVEHITLEFKIHKMCIITSMESVPILTATQQQPKAKKYYQDREGV